MPTAGCSDAALHEAIDGVLLALFSAPADEPTFPFDAPAVAAKPPAELAAAAAAAAATAAAAAGRVAESKRQVAAMAAARHGDGSAPPRLPAEYVVTVPPAVAPKPRATPSSFMDVGEEDDEQDDDAATRAQTPVEWTLPKMVVGAANEQYLFDVSVRAQYSEDAAVVGAALRELEQAAAEDFPAEAFLMRPALLEHAASLLHTADDDARVTSAAVAFLTQFVLSLRRALAARYERERERERRSVCVLRERERRSLS